MVVNALGALPDHSAFEMFTAGKQARQQNALGQIDMQTKQNALTQQTAQSLARGVISLPEDQRPQAYQMARQQAQAMGMDVSPFPEAYDQRADVMLRMVAEPEKMTDWQRKIEEYRALGATDEDVFNAISRDLGNMAPVQGPDVRTVGGEVVVVDPNERSATPIYSAPEEAPEAPDIIREAEILYPNNPEAQRAYVEQYRQKSGVNVNVSTGDTGPQVGTIPQGEMLVREGNTYRMEPIPGGPADREIQQGQEAAQNAEAAQQRSGGIVLQDIGRVRQAVEASPLTTTGIGGAILRQVPGTSAYDISALTETIGANVGLDRLQRMRKESPTGGALGQVTEREHKLLMSTLGNLEQSQSDEQVLTNLDRLEDVYLETLHGPFTRKERFADGRIAIQIGGEWYEVTQ